MATADSGILIDETETAWTKNTASRYETKRSHIRRGLHYRAVPHIGRARSLLGAVSNVDHGSKMRERLLQALRRLDADFEPFGNATRDRSDCSCGCRHFVKLAGEVGNDLGVCANPESPRAGLLTFEHQGCSAFEPIAVDCNLTDAQLRQLIGEASQILQDRRRGRSDLEVAGPPAVPSASGEFVYEVRTSYFPHIQGHFPSLFRLELHDGEFTPIPLDSRVGGNERPTVKGRFPAKNGEVFKIVRENGEYSYQIPLSGTIYNLA